MLGQQPSRRSYIVGTSAPLVLFIAATVGVLVGPPIVAEDDGLGTSFVMLVTYALAALLWGGLDGWLRVQLGWVVLRWITVGCLTAATVIVAYQWGYFDRVGAAEFALELAIGMMFLLIVVGGSASIGWFLGRLARQFGSDSLAGRPS